MNVEDAGDKGSLNVCGLWSKRTVCLHTTERTYTSRRVSIQSKSKTICQYFSWMLSKEHTECSV